MPAFKPQSQTWKSDRAVLLVHGIGDASSQGKAAFPLDELREALGANAANVAVYTLSYDFINDWAKRKTKLSSAVATLGATVMDHYADPLLSELLAEYMGDVLWPILSLDIRRAIRDAFIAQLQQIAIDCGESALARGDDPLDYRINIIAHSLGCFHTYEVLHAIANEPSYRLRPASDLIQLASVVLMASPVQMIRSVAGRIAALLPARGELASLAAGGLSLPAEKLASGKSSSVTRRFVAVSGTQDPVGGHLFGSQQAWAFMDIPGQQTDVVRQALVVPEDGRNLAEELSFRLETGLLGGGSGSISALVQDPHSWSAYVSREAELLAELLA